jgi:hypothetical protein
MLLSHVSGIHPDIMASGVITTGDYCADYMNNFIGTIAGFPMVTPELAAFTYANNSFTLLGVLIARMTGQDNYFNGFVDYMYSNVFSPLGMNSSTFAVTDRHTPYLAMPYADAHTPDTFYFYNAIPAGGVYSTAHDMARFMHAILNGGYLEERRLLPASSIDELLAVQEIAVDLLPDASMLPGLGFVHMTGLDGYVTVGHPGNLVHYHSNMVFDIDSGLGVFVSANSISGMPVLNLAAAILQAAVMEKTGTLNLPPSDATVTPVIRWIHELEELEGTYFFIGATHLTKAVIDMRTDGSGIGTLFIINFPGVTDPIELTPLSDGSFIAAALGLRFWFETVEGVTTLYLGEFKTHLAGVRLEEADFELLSSASTVFERWVGEYIAVTEGNHVSLISHATIGIDENGFPYMHLFALHGLEPFSYLVPLIVTNDRVVMAGGVELNAAGNGLWLEFSGIKMLKN